MTWLYNENDKPPAQWLRNLIVAGKLKGTVDERSIKDLKPSDVARHTRVHFFAGIGGWELALQLAGWPEEWPVWTGSCPCQPFSQAGRRRGFADERHLWPVWRELIRECKPPVIFGEQVASADGREWLGGQNGLQRMLDKETIIRVLQKSCKQKWIPDNLQELRSQSFQKMAAQEPRASISRLSQTQGKKTGTSVPTQFIRNKEIARCHQCGRLRTDWYSFQPGGGKDLGLPLFGSDRFVKGVYTRECPCGALLYQRHGESLGRTKNNRNLRRNSCNAPKQISESARKVGIRIEAAAAFPTLAGVRSDLEAMGYAVGAADLCAAGIGAPHIRQRLWWVAFTKNDGFTREQAARPGRTRMGDPTLYGWDSRRSESSGPIRSSGPGGMGHAECLGLPGEPRRRSGKEPSDGCSNGGAWNKSRWIACADGKARRIEPGITPLAHGVPGRVVKLRAYGNAIVPHLAAEFIAAFMKIVGMADDS